jgi:hypothetical protein
LGFNGVLGLRSTPVRLFDPGQVVAFSAVIVSSWRDSPCPWISDPRLKPSLLKRLWNDIFFKPYNYLKHGRHRLSIKKYKNNNNYKYYTLMGEI